MATEREIEQSLKNLQADVTGLDVRLEFAERRVQAIRHTNFVENFLSGLTDLGTLGFISSHLDWKHVASPANPSSGFQRIFADTDNSGHLTSRNSSGIEIDLEYLDADAIAAVEGEDTLLLTGNVSIAKSFVLSGDISPAQLTTNTNNYNPTDLNVSSTLRVSTDASRNLTGIVPAAPSDGRVLIIHNVGSNDLVLVDESASSTAANRFALSGNITLAGDDSLVMQYDSTSSRWRAISAITTPAGAAIVATDAIWDAKGDLAVGTGANTAQKLTVGADGTILGALASETTGLVYLARSAAAQLADIANTESAGTNTTIPFGDHVHAHPSGLTSSLHHTKYTDAEAISAVEGEATLVLAGLVTISKDTPLFELSHLGGDPARFRWTGSLFQIERDVLGVPQAELTINFGTSIVEILNNLKVSGTLSVDTINENTAGSGVTIDNVTIKDGAVEFHHGTDTIATDEITSPTGGYIIAAAQTGTTDDLDGIGGGANGRIIVVRADAGDVITVRHNDAGAGAGRDILTNDNAAVTLTGNDEDSITLMYDESLLAAAGAWFEISRGSAAGSGDVATDAIWDAKGDLAGGTGANTAVRLAVGADGTVLGALASETTGLVYLTRSGTAQLADIANTESAGSDTTVPFGDHVHAHPSGLTSSLHHTKYTDAEAISAVEGEATLDLLGDITIQDGTASKTLSILVTGDANPKMSLEDDQLQFGAGGANALNASVKYVGGILEIHASPSKSIKAFNTILPSADDTWNLGTTAVAWKDLFLEGVLQVDVIAEQNAGVGVTIDGLLIKDSAIPDEHVTSRRTAPTVIREVCTTNTTVSNTLISISGVASTFTPDIASTAIVWGVYDIDGSTTGDVFVGRLDVDGAVETQEMIYEVAAGANDRKTITQVWAVNLTAASHTLTLQAIRAGGSGTALVRTPHSHMIIWVIGDANVTLS